MVIKSIFHVSQFYIKRHFIKYQLWVRIWGEGCARRLSNTKKYSNHFFQFSSNSFFQNKQVIQQWESQHFGPVVSQFMNNLPCRPMFHRVFVQTQIKPGTGFWGLELWKEKRVEVFSTSLRPNHVIPGRALAKFGSGHVRGWQTTKMCGFVTGRPPPTPDTLPLPHS